MLFNPKCVGHVYNITVAVDNLGNMIWICNLMQGPAADVTIWDQRGPSRTHDQFFHYEVGTHDGAYKGGLHSAVPYMRPNKNIIMCMAFILQGWSTSLLACGTGGLFEMCGQALLSNCMVLCAFCFMLLNFVSADRLGIRPMDFGFMCRSLADVP